MSQIIPISFHKPDIHPKKWGKEEWLVNNDKYCAKILSFNAGEEFSNHYHFIKEETWFLISGKLVLEYFDLSNADKLSKILNAGDIVHIPPGNPHKLIAVEASVLFEASTKHYESDSYRIGKGSSQKEMNAGDTLENLFKGSEGRIVKTYG